MLKPDSVSNGCKFNQIDVRYIWQYPAESAAGMSLRSGFQTADPDRGNRVQQRLGNIQSCGRCEENSGC